jgi:hypothetical protein
VGILRWLANDAGLVVTLSGVSHRGTICRRLSRRYLRSFYSQVLTQIVSRVFATYPASRQALAAHLADLTGEGDAEEMFSRKEAIDQVLEAANFTELIAALNAPVK